MGSAAQAMRLMQLSLHGNTHVAAHMYSRELLRGGLQPQPTNKGQLQNSWLASSQARLPVLGAAGEWHSQQLCREQLTLACPWRGLSLHLSSASGRVAAWEM